MLLLHHHSFSSTKKNLHQLCDNSFCTFYWIHEFILKIQVFFRGNFHWTGHWTVWTLSRKDFLVGFKLGPIYRDLSGLETEKFSQVWFAVQWNGFWSWPFSIKYFPSSQSKIFHEFRWSSRWIKTMVEFQ